MIPSLSVVQVLPFISETMRPRFLIAEAHRSVQETINEPLKADWHFNQAASEFRGHTINERAADDDLPNRRILAPLSALPKEIRNGDGQVMVRVHQAGVPADNTVAVVVCIVQGHVERSRRAISRCIAYGDEQSMRIFPSESTVMKRKVGSTESLATSAPIP